MNLWPQGKILLPVTVSLLVGGTGTFTVIGSVTSLSGVLANTATVNVDPRVAHTNGSNSSAMITNYIAS